MSPTALDKLSPEQRQAVGALAEYLRPSLAQSQQLTNLTATPANGEPQDIISWGEKNYYVPGLIDGTAPQLIKLLPHQKTILKCFFDKDVSASFGVPTGFQTLVYSTVKKSGKTEIASMVARWIAETWGAFSEVYCLANDLEQARGRIYQGVTKSIELSPGFDRAKRRISGQWRIIERDTTHIPSGSKVRAVSSDYKGEAGSSPVATLWSELWGYSLESLRRLWDELTPVPTRPRSIRYVETYAGFESESELLIELYEKATRDGRRITLDELRAAGLDWPWPDQQLPFFVNERMRLFAYWDEGVQARRMPWQTPEYYAAQAADLRPETFARLHENKWTSGASAFIPIEWWDRLGPTSFPLPSLAPGDKTPLVVGVDASVSSDCTAISAVSRYPDVSRPDDIAIRMFKAWTPSEGHPMDYGTTIEPTLRLWCTGHIHPLWEDCNTHSRLVELGPCPNQQPYNIVQVAYDAFQLHDMMTRFRSEGVAWCRSFSQSTDRMVADYQLYTLIRDKRIAHNGDPDLRDHIAGAAAKLQKGDNTKLRIIKKSTRSKIDGAVATSMAAYECKRLLL